MLKIYSVNQNEEWLKIITSFESYDTYYLLEYVKTFAQFENAVPLLIYYKNNETEYAYIVEKQDISCFYAFNGTLKTDKYFDITTPYGYGGPLAKNHSDSEMQNFLKELSAWANENNIVSHFFRFHPLTQNQKLMEKFIETRYVRKSVYMDLSSEEVIYSNMIDKCRNMVKKALKNDIHIEIDNSVESQNRFKQLYAETMRRNNADEYYYFREDFFKILFDSLGGCCNLFTAKYNDIIISSAIIYEGNKFVHYHLSAADREYMKLAGNNLLLYEVAKYGCKKGYKMFHMGGGVGCDEDDNLYKFKKSFNKKEPLEAYIGRIIFNGNIYDELMQKRKNLDKDFDLNTSRMIGYRA